MIKFKVKGDYKKTTRFLQNAQKKLGDAVLRYYGSKGVDILKQATPIDTGATAAAWSYAIEHGRNKTKIIWANDNIVDGVHVALVIQYGHVTNGVYVQGRDYINPAVQPLFDDIVDSVWKEVIGS